MNPCGVRRMNWQIGWKKAIAQRMVRLSPPRQADPEVKKENASFA